MGDISAYYCSCGELLNDCPFWKKVKSKMLAKNFDFSLDQFKTHFRAYQEPFYDRLLRATFRGPFFEAARETGFILCPAAKKIRQHIIKQNRTLIDIICDLQQGLIFLDDSKEPIRLKYLLDAEMWDIRTIHLIRDGRGVANSYMKHNKTSMSRAARQWFSTQQECDRMAKRLGNNRCLTVFYEDLCRDPEDTLKVIHDFLGLATETMSASNQTKHIMGNKMRLGSLQEIQLDEKWRHTLTIEDLAIFEQIAGEINQFHGYK